MSADTVTKKILEKYQLLSSTDSDNIIEYFSEQDNSANSKFVNTSRISKSKFDDYEAFGAEAGLTGHEMDRLKVKLKECEGSETSYVNDVCPYPSLTALQSTAPVDDDSGVQNNLSTGTLIQSQDVNVNNRSEIRIKATREKLKEKTVTNLKISKSRVTKSMILKKNTFLKQRSIRNCKFQDKKETYENVTALRGDSARMLWQPIPDSLMQLRQSSGRENKERTQPSLCVIDGMTSATEESTFLNIITVDGQEETIAFHRSVGTDPEIHDVKEAAEERVLNVTQDERLTSRYVMSDEKANSSTFLHDIDEPSTSEGVRNYSTDVQCGPDVFCDHITLSVTTSTVKISKRHTTGIRIEDSDTDVPIINRLDYYADTKMIANKCSDANSVGHSESNCTVTYSDNKYETNPSEMSSSLQQNPLVTELIKPSFSLDKAKDSCSVRVCDSTSSFLKFPENESRLKSQSELDNDISRHSSPLHYLKSKLSYGGIYVHSFKDKRMAEDIVYQGDWQKNISNRKVFARKNPSRSYVKRNEIHKKRYDANNKKNVHIAPRSTDEETASNPKKVNILKKSHLHSFKNTDAPLKKKTVKFVRPVDKAKYSKRSKSVTKVASKIITSVVNYKNNTPAISSIKPLQTSTPIKCPTSIERKVINVNNYIPTYLKKKRLPKFTKNNIKHLNDGLSSLLFNDKTCGLISHDQKEIRQETYPFRNEKNITYFVYRNEIDPENVLSCVEPGCAANYGSSSIHKTSISNISSPCSSPNSLVTVRNVTLPNQIDYGNIISTSSDKSISESYDLDTNVSKTKKILRKCKIKKTNMTLDVQDNKENITESSRNSCALPKAIKKPFLGTNKTVYLTHMSTETVPNTHQIVCRKKWPTPVLIKPTPTNIENKLSNICKKVSTDIAMTSTDVASSMQKKELLFSDLNHLKGNKAKEDLGQTCLKEGGMQCIEFYIKSIIEEKINNIDHFITNSHGSTVDITPSEINVEKNNSGYGILNNDAQDLNLQKRMSAISSTLNKTSSIELKQVRSIVTDTDLLSFKSFASSKISEYFLADNDLEEDFFLQLNNSTSSLFQDIIDNCKQNRSQQQVQSTNNLNNSKTAVHKRLDYVNSVDSETGSRTFTVSKRVTSEELFASNGSTETYESCAVEEDVLVPEWLFEVDSGQEEDPSGLSVPGDQEELGLNGNVSEPSAVVGAGAGDGRGMHSDLSQESSGRGTSLSSSGTSSGQESQGVLSDLSESTVPNGSIQESRESAASNAPHEPLPDNRVVLPTSRAEPAGILTIPVRTASDGHVDVTSLIPGGLQLNN